MASSSAATQNSASIVFDSRPSEDLATGPVHDRNEVEEATPHLDIGYIRTPDLVRPINAQVPQQIRIDLVLRVRLARLRTLIDRRQAHLGHQSTDAMAPNTPAIAPQMTCHLARAVPGRLQELLVNQPQQSERLFALRTGLTVE